MSPSGFVLNLATRLYPNSKHLIWRFCQTWKSRYCDMKCKAEYDFLEIEKGLVRLCAGLDDLPRELKIRKRSTRDFLSKIVNDIFPN